MFHLAAFYQSVDPAGVFVSLAAPNDQAVTVETPNILVPTLNQLILAAAGVERSVGSVGDSFDNALAETINGLYKTEVIRRSGPWRNVDAVESATLFWVDWFNTGASSSRSVTCHPWSSKPRTTQVERVGSWRPDKEPADISGRGR